MSPLPGVGKGNKFARAVAAFLGTEVRALCGALDRGDLVLKRWVAEVKCAGRGKPLNLSAAMTEARIEAANAGVERYCVIARRTGHGVAESFFVIPLWMAREMGLPE